MDYRKESLKKHYEWKGKIEVAVQQHRAGQLDFVARPGRILQRDGAFQGLGPDFEPETGAIPGPGRDSGPAGDEDESRQG